MLKPPCESRESAGTDSEIDVSAKWTNRRASERATRAANARQVSGRRRFVDPTTCEREYTDAETEFMMAMNEYKRRSGRMFPTWSEVLEVLQGLGYEKMPPADLREIAADSAAPRSVYRSKARLPDSERRPLPPAEHLTLCLLPLTRPRQLRREDGQSKAGAEKHTRASRSRKRWQSRARASGWRREGPSLCVACRVAETAFYADFTKARTWRFAGTRDRQSQDGCRRKGHSQ